MNEKTREKKSSFEATVGLRILIPVSMLQKLSDEISMKNQTMSRFVKELISEYFSKKEVKEDGPKKGIQEQKRKSA